MKRKLTHEGETLPVVELTGCTLTPEDLVAIGTRTKAITVSEEAWARIRNGRKVVDEILERGTVAYGINTGFGVFSEVAIEPAKLIELQENLIRSHAAGTGPLLSPERTRMLFALRMNVLCKGHSGISEQTFRIALSQLQADCMPAVPCKGTVGASGDLAPLSHLALGMMGEGDMWDPSTGKIGFAGDILKKHSLSAVQLIAKEGLALINGTQLITALGSEALVRAKNACKVADICCALTLEVLKGTASAFHPKIHESRPHIGQNTVASRLRALLKGPSEVFLSHNYKGRVQDAYSLRCAPQIHGVSNDTVEFVDRILTTELNSATDNPMVFTAEAHVETMKPPTVESETKDQAEIEVTNLDSAKREIKRLKKALAANHRPAAIFKQATTSFYSAPAGGFVVSGGNFHGEYPAKAMDYLAIGVHELASVSERRIERLVNPTLSGLPGFLVPQGGLNSGLMIAHCTAAALVSENKVLCHPSSVDSISTSAAKEDHVSMGGFASRKALEVVTHVETVLAIELMAGCQALEFLRPLRTTPPLERIYSLVRTVVAPLEKDRHMSKDIAAVLQLVQSGAVYDAVKDLIEPLMLEDEHLPEVAKAELRAQE